MAESGNGPGASGDRRGFLVCLTRVFLGFWAVGGGAAIAAYMRPPERHDTSSENVVRVGLLGDYRIGEARMVRHGVTPPNRNSLVRSATSGPPSPGNHGNSCASEFR